MRVFWKPVLVAVLGLMASPAGASLSITGTRVVFPQEAVSVAVKVANVGPSPVLVQAWLDDGDAGKSPELVRVPLVVTPPLFRLDVGKDRQLVLRAAGESGLPSDREALYWLNVLEVVPSQPREDGTSFQLNTRVRLKVFHRPVGLVGSAAQAPAALRWQWQQAAAGPQVEVSNPTPWYVNVTTVRIGDTVLDNGDGVIPPLSSRVYPTLPTGMPKESDARDLHFGWVDDLGVEHQSKASIGR